MDKLYYQALNLCLENEFCLRLSDVCIKVITNDTTLASGLKQYFADFLCDSGQAYILIVCYQGYLPLPEGVSFTDKAPEANKRKIKEEYYQNENWRIVRKKLTGMVFVFNADRHLAFGDCNANPNQVINFVNNRYIQQRLEAKSQLLHASGVSKAGKGLAICGFAGAGKSTLAIRALESGFDFVSNDRLILRKEDDLPVIEGLVKYPRINPGTILYNPRLHYLLDTEELERLSLLPDDELRNLEQKYDLIIDDVYGKNRFHLSAVLSGLVILNWKWECSETHCERVSLTDRRDLMPAFMKSPGLFFYSNEEYEQSEDAYLELLKDCPIYEVSGGVDFLVMVKNLSAMLTSDTDS